MLDWRFAECSEVGSLGKLMLVLPHCVRIQQALCKIQAIGTLF